MKNLWIGMALGIGAAGVVVAIVLALSGDEETVVIERAAPPPATTAAPSAQDGAGPGAAEAAGGGEAVNTGGSVGQAARAYCEREQRDPDDFASEFGSGQAGMANCVETETRKARSECEADLRNDPDDYRRQFGGADEAAFERCLVYELSS